MKFIFLLIINFLILFDSVCSAQTTVRHTLSWGDYQQDEGLALGFTGCIFDSSGFSVFSTMIPIEKDKNISDVRIINDVYSPVDSQYTYLFNKYTFNENPQVKIQHLTSSKQKYACLNIVPFRKNPTTRLPEKLITFEISYTTIKAINKDNVSKLNYVEHSALANGEWARVGVYNTGIQKITYEDLLTMGFSLPIESDKIRVFGNGGRMLPEVTSDPRTDDLIQVTRKISDNGDGWLDQPGDYLLFYAEGPLNWNFDEMNLTFTHQLNLYSDFSCYFINVSDSPGFQVNYINSDPAIPDVYIDHFQDYMFHELDSVNLLRSGKTWFGEVFNTSDVKAFHFSFPNISETDTLFINTSLAARALDTSFFHINLFDNTADVLINMVDMNVNTDYIKMTLNKMKVMPESDNFDISITYEKPNESAIGWLNYIEAIATRALIFTGGQMSFRNCMTLGQGVAQYQINNISATCKLWDVTDPEQIKEIELILSGTDGYFRQSTDSLREYVLFDGTLFYSPVFIEKVKNQDLHGTGFPDLVIITHPSLKNQADRLADFHRNNDGFEVFVTEPQLIYNEFSSGKQDPSALRDFLRMLYLRAGNDSLLFPHYVLLFGDGSYDMKNRINPNTNLIPTYQTANSHTPTSSFVSDDFFGLFDDGEGPNAAGLMDAGVGRLPVSKIEEATALVDKIIRYSSRVDLLPPSSEPAPGQVSNFAEWRNTLTFIADDEDGNLHFKQAETLAKIVDSLSENANINKLYLDAFQQDETFLGPRYPAVREAINSIIAIGTLILNYTGHGGETGLAEERIVEISDIDGWNNYYNMPVVITATCEFSRYDNPAEESAGEHILLNPNGGGVAMFSTTRVAYAHSNMIINTNVLIAAFEKGSTRRLGDIIRIGKVRSGTGVYIQNFTLLGDPAMRLSVPEYKVSTTNLDGDSLSHGNDTIYSGQRITVNGYIADFEDNILTDFNGVTNIVVFDKPEKVSTLANDPQSYIANFYAQMDVLFRGTASVNQGLFSFSFTLPKDVSFRNGNARISYYAKSLEKDAAGYYDDLCLVNNENAGSGDGKGPDINMFMNDRNFVSDGMTSSNANLIADLIDNDGINFFGAGIGHDIIMVLDDDYVNPTVMNDYYSPAINDANRGTVLYSFEGLTEGQHKIWLRCWDVLNYTAESELTFIVRENHDLSLNHVKVFPNPMSNTTSFCFDRNKTTGNQWAQINIRTIDGRDVRLIEKELFGALDISVCLNWDGCTENGNAAPAGIYLFTLKITDNNGFHQQFSGKITKLE